MIKFILGVIVTIVALVFLGTPTGRFKVATLAGHLQNLSGQAPAAALPKLDEEELAAPPISGEAADAAAPKVPSVTVKPVESAAGPDDTFSAVMEVYERAERDQADESAKQ